MPSSVIDHFEYEAGRKILRIRFLSGAVYEYQNVSRQEFAKMKRASSKGKYLNEFIKGKYDFEQVA